LSDALSLLAFSFIHAKITLSSPSSSPSPPFCLHSTQLQFNSPPPLPPPSTSESSIPSIQQATQLNKQQQTTN
jgi:hypothetical protein